MPDSRPATPEPAKEEKEAEIVVEHNSAGTPVVEAAEEAPALLEAPNDVEEDINQLRDSLATAQDLIKTQSVKLTTLADIEDELKSLKDQFQFISAAKEAVENQLQEEIKRREAAEESVEILRGQVDQARRGVGLLQKQEQERKRMSLLPPAVPVPVEGDEASGVDKDATSSASRASKRASILGRASRRTSGQESDFLQSTVPSQPSSSPSVGAQPRAGGLRELRLSSGGMYGSPGAGSVASPTTGVLMEEDAVEVTPRPANLRHSSSSGAPGSTASVHSTLPQTSEAEEKLRAELAATRARLADAEEARDASETCLRALREFMAGGEEGAPPDELLKGISLPPLPSARDSDEIAQDAKAAAGGNKGGWGFKLWKQTPLVSPPASTAVEPSATPADTASLSVAQSTQGTSPLGSPAAAPGDLPTESTVHAVPSSITPLANFVSGWTKGVSPGTPSESKQESKPSAGRSISSFFSRNKEDTPATTSEKNKELPAEPPVEVKEVPASGLTVEDAATLPLSPASQLSEIPLEDGTEEAKEDKAAEAVKEDKEKEVVA